MRFVQTEVPFTASSFLVNNVYSFVCFALNADGMSAPSNRYYMLMCARIAGACPHPADLPICPLRHILHVPLRPSL